MEKRNYLDNATLGILTIFIYFYFVFQNLPSGIFSFFNLNIEEINSTLKIIYTAMFEILTLAIILLINHNKIEYDFKDIKKNYHKYFSSCLKYWLLSLFVMMLSNLIIMFIFNSELASNEEAVRSIFKINPIYVYISAVFIAPFIEELVFRQGIRNIITNKIGFIIVSGLIFGLIHVMTDIKTWYDFLYIIPYSSTGIAFAYILTKTDNIFTTIGFHILHNGLLLSVQFLVLLFG